MARNDSKLNPEGEVAPLDLATPGASRKVARDPMSELVVLAPTDALVPPTLSLPTTTLINPITVVADVDAIEAPHVVQLSPDCALLLGAFMHEFQLMDLGFDSSRLRVVIPFEVSDEIAMSQWRELRSQLPTYSGYNDIELTEIGKKYAVSRNDHVHDVKERPENGDEPIIIDPDAASLDEPAMTDEESTYG
jgi:hypothetical protein